MTAPYVCPSCCTSACVVAGRVTVWHASWCTPRLRSRYQGGHALPRRRGPSGGRIETVPHPTPSSSL